MIEEREVKLPSGAVLKIQPASFPRAKALWQSMLDELQSIDVDPDAEVDVNLIKGLFCRGFSSRKIESCLDECFKSVLYNNQKITEDTFEPVSSRQDFVVVCSEVALENVSPFLKGLSVGYLQDFAKRARSHR